MKQKTPYHCISFTSRYVNTINLQIEVTKFLQRYYENLDAVVMRLSSRESTAAASAYPSSSQREKGLPTLFGSTKTKTEVVLLVGIFQHSYQ